MSTQNQGAQLFLRTADGTLQQLPWKGLIHRPNQASITEPSIVWRPAARPRRAAAGESASAHGRERDPLGVPVPRS
jgi:hypothetical protein